MEILATLLIIIMLSVYMTTVFKQNRTIKNDELEKERDELQANINAKREQLEMLSTEQEAKKLNKKVNLTNASVKALDIYKDSNIQVPADILEELSYMNFYDTKETFDYIENQRYYWKLENTKKPYRKVK